MVRKSRSWRQLLNAIRAQRYRVVDLGTIQQQDSLVIMASAGFDAEVVREMSMNRTGAISHLSYLDPIRRVYANWDPPLFEITVDDQILMQSSRGIAIVTNSSQYGLRMDPIPSAQMDDGLLDVTLIPATTGLRALLQGIRSRLMRRFGGLKGLVIGRGSHIQITADRPFGVQVDGDPALGGVSRDQWSFSSKPAALKVLLPGP